MVLGAFAVAGAANSAVIFMEDFNGGGTGVFGVTAISSVMWDDMTAQGDGNYTGGTGNAMTANSDAFVNTAFDTVATASVNAVGYENLVLSFLLNFQKNGANGSVGTGDADRLEVYAGGNLLETIASDNGSLFNTPGVAKSYNLSPSLNNTAFDIKFRYVDESSSAWEWYAQVDDVMVSGTEVPEPATMAILGLGVAALARRRRNK
jgi:hypothetical protein